MIDTGSKTEAGLPRQSLIRILRERLENLIQFGIALPSWLA